MEQLKQGTLRGVAFADLWHLLSPGVEIMNNVPNNSHHTLRVFGVTGGRSFLCDRKSAFLPTFKNQGAYDRDVPKFEVYAHYFVSDGQTLVKSQ